MNIPSFDGLIDEIRQYILSHSNSLGFLDLRDTANDTIYTVYYDMQDNDVSETEILGLRVKDNEIELLPNFWDLDISSGDEDLNKSEMWHPLQNSDIIYFYHTLLAIAESIEEYF